MAHVNTCKYVCAPCLLRQFPLQVPTTRLSRRVLPHPLAAWEGSRVRKLSWRLAGGTHVSLSLPPTGGCIVRQPLVEVLGKATVSKRQPHPWKRQSLESCLRLCTFVGIHQLQQDSGMDKWAAKMYGFACPW